jgi:hypothetical protein
VTKLKPALKKAAVKKSAAKKTAAKKKRVTFPRVKLDQQVKQWYQSSIGC